MEVNKLCQFNHLIEKKIKSIFFRFPQNSIPYLKNHRPEYRKILLALVAIAVSVVWFVFRNEE